MTYHDLLNFKKQFIVDEVYKRAKEEFDDEELDKAYEEITQRNQSKSQTAQYKYWQIMNYVYDGVIIFWLIIFAIVFLITGSFLLAGLIIVLITPIEVEMVQNLIAWFQQLGMNTYDRFFATGIGMNAAETLKTGIPAMMYEIAGLSIVLIVIFTIIYLLSFFKEVEVKEKRKVNLEESFHYLQVSEDDDWSYIRYSLEKRLGKRRNKTFFELYYSSYLCIFQNYQSVEGNFKELSRKYQCFLCLRTFGNTVKNILGSFSMPVYFSIAFLIVYYRNFTIREDFTLQLFIEAIPSIGKQLWSLFESSYQFLMQFSMFSLMIRMRKEMAMVLSLCICITLIYVIYQGVTKKRIESFRQYHRRKNFYLKKEQGMYSEEKKYAKTFLYTTQFLVFVLFFGACVFVYKSDVPITFVMDPKQQEQAQQCMDTRQKINERIQKYAQDEKQSFTLLKPVFRTDYVYVDALYADVKQKAPYLKIYTFYNETEAKEAIKESILIKDEELKTNKKLKIEYYYSKDGFILRDHGVVIVMKNNASLCDTLLTSDMIIKDEKQEVKDIKKIIQSIGYKI